MITEETKMPTGVHDLFVPPDGAMKFELIPNGMTYGNSVAQWDDCDRPAIWVMPPIKNDLSCGCTIAYPVIRESLSERMKQLYDVSKYKVIVVCACVGRVIE